MSSGSSRLRRLAPETCPTCGGENTFSILDGRVECQRCGYQHSDEQPEKPRQQGTAASPQQTDPRAHLKPSLSLLYREDLNPWASAAFTTAQDHIHRKQWAEALKSIHRALEYEPHFTDAHLWAGYLEEDEAKKREHFSFVIAHHPDHQGVIRELMVMNGELSREEANALNDPYLEPERRLAGGAVRLSGQSLRCKVCGSNRMSNDELTGEAICESCGSINRLSQAPTSGGSALTKALLKRRVQPVKWVVGEHLLECGHCGAKRTIPATTLTRACPFCDSKQVFKRDALDSFQQPDGLVPFTINRDEALERLKSRLGGWREKLRGLLDNNEVERIALEGLFLPFWMFDASVEIRRTINRSTQSYERNDRYQAVPRPAYESNTFADAINNVEVCAVKSPAPFLTRKLGDYSLGNMQPYDPGLLARFSAELYSIDFDEASLNARQIISDSMRQKHQVGTTEFNAEVYIYSNIRQMSFQLVLMPVWVATLREADNDIRPALINGQSGQVVMGKARRPTADDV